MAELVERDNDFESDNEEHALLEANEKDEDNVEDMPNVLRNLSKVLTTMSESMSSMNNSIKRINHGEQSGAEQRQKTAKKRRMNRNEEHDDDESDISDGEHLLNTTAPPVDATTEGETSVSDAQREHDALLTEISHDFDQEEDVGPEINQQLAEIINKRWSVKLNEAKLKEKLEKISRPSNCDGLTVPRVNTEIWDKLDNKTRQQDLRASITQKSLAKVGAILAKSTEMLVQMRQHKSPEVDQLLKWNTDALALLGHTSCELSLRRREFIKPNLHKDYRSLCASHVPVTACLFGDNLQTRLNDIRASNKISKTTVPERGNYGQGLMRGRWSNTNAGNVDNRQRRGNHFLSRGLPRRRPPKPFPQYPRREPTTKTNQTYQKQ